MLHFIPLESFEGDRLFYFIRQICNWFCNSIPSDILSNSADIAMNGYKILNLKTDVCKTYISNHTHKMIAPSLFTDA